MHHQKIPKDKRIEREQGDVNTTQNRLKYWERNLSGNAKYWFDEDKTYFLHQSLSTPVLNVLSKAHGIYLQDLDGKKYIDMHGNGVHNAGFNNPLVIKAVKQQLEEGMTFCPRRYTNIPAIKLAKKLAQITPDGLCRSLFCPGGSEAIEMALMLARQVSKHFKTISYWDSFHGAGFGSASIGGEEHFSSGFGPMIPGAFHVEFPNYYRNPWGYSHKADVDAECLRQMEIVFKRNPEIAADLFQLPAADRGQVLAEHQHLPFVGTHEPQHVLQYHALSHPARADDHRRRPFPDGHVDAFEHLLTAEGLLDPQQLNNRVPLSWRHVSPFREEWH